jgi:hypothetical protein
MCLQDIGARREPYRDTKRVAMKRKCLGIHLGPVGLASDYWLASDYIFVTV